jgi:SsrA-binding protein
MASDGIKVIGKNRKAYHNYTVDEHLECGVELKGTEVKSMKDNKFSFSDSYARIRDDELWLIGLHITPYEQGSIDNHVPERERKLLIHKHELKRLRRQTEEKGYTLVPLDFHLKRGLVKVDLGVCKGKRLYDKRQAIKARDQKLDAEREFRDNF